MKRYLFLTVTLVLFFSLAVNAFAATYYIKNGGNDSKDGLSDATAWATIDKVSTVLNYGGATGHDVYFKCGDTWIGKRLTIRWSGTPENRVVIGAYYMNGDTEARGVSGGNKPIINGNNTAPGNHYVGLIQADGYDYISVENLRVINSYGEGVSFANTTGCNITNVEIDHAFDSGIEYYKSDSGTIDNCDVTDVCRRTIEAPGTDWPAAVAMITDTHDITLKNSTIYENYGEGVGVYKSSYDNIIENNIVYANLKGNIYIDHSQRTLIRRNLVYGTTNSTFGRGTAEGKFPANGIGICDELGQVGYDRTEGTQIYNNLVAYCYKGISLDTGTSSGAFIKDTVVYNNTVVDCRYILYLYGPYSNSFVRNNIFWSTSSGGSFPSELFIGSTNTPGLIWDHNSWSSAVSGDLSGTGDIIGVPELQKITGWRSMKGGDLKASDFALQPSSPLIDKGRTLGAEFDDAPDCDNSVWPLKIVLKDQDKQGSGWEIGADIHVANPTALDPPSDLKIVSAP